MTLPPFLGFLQKESSRAPQCFFALRKKSVQDLSHLIPFFSLYNLNSYFSLPTSVATAAVILHVSVQL